MTEVTYRGWRIERGAMGYWTGRKNGETAGPWPTEEQLQAAIDRWEASYAPPMERGAAFSAAVDRLNELQRETRGGPPPPPPPPSGTYCPPELDELHNPVVTAIKDPINLLLAALCWCALGGLVWLVLR